MNEIQDTKTILGKTLKFSGTTTATTWRLSEFGDDGSYTTWTVYRFIQPAADPWALDVFRQVRGLTTMCGVFAGDEASLEPAWLAHASEAAPRLCVLATDAMALAEAAA